MSFKLIKIMILAFVLIPIFLSSQVSQRNVYSAETMEHEYVYLSQNINGDLYLNTMSTSGISDRMITQIDINLDNNRVNAYLNEADWLTLTLSNEEYSDQFVIKTIYLVNILTKERHIFEANILTLDERTRTSEDTGDAFVESPSNHHDSKNLTGWSNEGTHFAYIVQSEDFSGGNVALFDVDSNSRELIEIPSGRPTRIFWLSQNHIAVFIEKCDPCEGFIEIFDLSSNTLVSSTKVYRSGLPLTVLGICDFKIAETNQFFSFNSMCDRRLEARKDIFIADTETGNVVATTQFTQNGIYPGGDAPSDVRYRYGIYRSSWLNGNNLIFGATYANETLENIVSEIVLYDITANTQQVILENTMAFEFAIQNEQIAFAEVSATLYPFAVDTIAVNIAEIDGQSFQILNQFDGGCYLSWTEDSQYLAFARSESNSYRNCIEDPDEIVLVDIASNNTIEFEVSSENRVIPLGWIK